MNMKTPPRLAIDITDGQAEELRKLIRWGLRKSIYIELTDMLIALLKEHGEAAIWAIVDGKLKFTLSEEGDDYIKRSEGKHNGSS